MRTLLKLCFFMLFFTFKAYAETPKTPACLPGNSCQDTIVWQGVPRSFTYYLPRFYTPNLRYLSLVIALHSTGETGANLEKGLMQGSFDSIAEKARMLVVYPDALKGDWNSETTNKEIDDVGFIRAVIEYFQQKYYINPYRIYAVGMSTGGMMAYRLACESADRITAIATVNSAMPTSLAAICKPVRPVSVLMINGTRDPILPWNSHHMLSVMGDSRGTRLTIPETVALWRKINNITSAITQEPLPHSQYDNTWVWISKSASLIANGPEVIQYTVYNGGHTWPGGAQYLPVNYIGETSKAFSASAAIWQFLISHRQVPLPQLVTPKWAVKQN